MRRAALFGLTALMLMGCGQPEPTAVMPMASRMSVGGADETTVSAAMWIQSGTIVNPVEPEGFASDAESL